MPNVIDGRNSGESDFFGTPFGFTFGLSSSDDLLPVLFGYETASPDADTTGPTRVSLSKESGLGTQTLTAFGAFPALPTDPAEVAVWREIVNATPIAAARLTSPSAEVFDFSFSTPVPVGVFGETVTNFLAGDDKIIGTKWKDFIGGKAGDDLLLGRGGDDGMDGGAGNDVLKGGGGHDNLTGGDGDDRLIGNGGNDQLFSGFGNDMLLGGAGNDFLFAEWGNAGEIKKINAGKGNDVIELGLDGIVGAAFDSLLASPLSVHAPAGSESAFKIRNILVRDDDEDEDEDTLLVDIDDEDPDGDDGPDGVFARFAVSESKVDWSIGLDQTGLQAIAAEFTANLRGIEKREVRVTGLTEFETDFSRSKGPIFIIDETLDADSIGSRLFATTDEAVFGFDIITPRLGMSYVLITTGKSDLVQLKNTGRFYDSSWLRLRGGDDTVICNFDESRIFLGAGDDFAGCGAGRQTIVDGNGADKSRGGGGNDTFAFVADGTRDRILDWAPGDVIAIEGLDGATFDLLTGKEIAPNRFVLEFQGDKLDVKAKAPGATLDDVLHIDNFDFDFFPIPLT